MKACFNCPFADSSNSKSKEEFRPRVVVISLIIFPFLIYVIYRSRHHCAMRPTISSRLLGPSSARLFSSSSLLLLVLSIALLLLGAERPILAADLAPSEALALEALCIQVVPVKTWRLLRQLRGRASPGGGSWCIARLPPRRLRLFA